MVVSILVFPLSLPPEIMDTEVNTIMIELLIINNLYFVANFVVQYFIVFVEFYLRI